MSHRITKPGIVLPLFLVFALLLRGVPVHAVEEEALSEGVPPPPEGAPPQAPPDDTRSAGRTPPRLSFVDGSVSFWRPGADEWAPAQINTPLAPGDAVYTAEAANLELQIGSRAYVRAGAGTQLSFENQEPEFLQFKITIGHVSLDLRSLALGSRIELDTPNAAFTIDHSGYYRVDVDGETTTFTTRRGGYAAMTPVGGAVAAISPSEQVVIAGTETANVETYVAPEPSSWDQWNYERTDYLIDALSARYVPPGVYGADALDHYGTWRVVGNYGPVWVPQAVAPTWAPYSTGRWIWDPLYGWTWVDTAPWGWAPYHYGRWVYVNEYWAWAPGPAVAPVYAPALVAFFGGSGFGVSISTAPVGWVALGWGEPCTPWWGRPGFVGTPWWGGWGGPHVVNNTVINNTTIVNVNNIHTYRNVDVPHAMVAVPRDHFGRGGIDKARLQSFDPHRLQPIHGPVPVKPSPASLLPASGRSVRPPESVLQRRVVGTRPSHDPAPELRSAGLQSAPSVRVPEPRLVPAPHRTQSSLGSPRPPFGPSTAPERARPSLPPRFQENAPQESVPRHQPAHEAVQPEMRPPVAPGRNNVGQRPEGPRPQRPGPADTHPVPGPAPRQAPVEAPVHSAPPPHMPPPGREPAPRMPPHGAPQPAAPARNAPPLPPQAPPPQMQVPRGEPSRDMAPRRAPQHDAPPMAAPPSAPAPQVQRPQPAPRPLPGEPANRVYPGQGGGQPQHFDAPQRAPAAPPAPGPHGGGGMGRSAERQYGERSQPQRRAAN